MEALQSPSSSTVPPPPLPSRKGHFALSTFSWAALAVLCFHLAYAFPPLAFLLAIFIYSLARIAHASSPRFAFYAGLLTGLACIVPQLLFLAHIFRLFVVLIWILLALWIGLFPSLLCAIKQSRLPRYSWLIFLPILWTGLEYFRCELYYFRFAWLTPGLALGNSSLVSALAVYGAGFVLSSAAACVLPLRKWHAIMAACLCAGPFAWLSNIHAQSHNDAPSLRVTGIQLEFPDDADLKDALDSAISQFPDTDLLVLPEYTLGIAPPPWIKAWCRDHRRYLVVGGEDFFTDLATGKETWSDTAFVISPAGDIVFSQAKAIPIQFFADGQPAKEQRLWDSPWGRIGICICYDLDFSRVTDQLVRQGAQLLIVPTMDVASWAAQEHRLHSLIAPARAAEYRVPSFALPVPGCRKS